MSNLSRYSWQIWVNDQRFVDLSGYISNRFFSQSRNRPEEINFSISLDALMQLSRDLEVNPQDILQTGRGEIRVYRGGLPLVAGQIMYWEANLGQDREIAVKGRGWMELLKYRLTNNTYTSEQVTTILRDLVTTTQALPNGDFGIVNNAVPSPDDSNTYTKTYENKKIYDAFIEMTEDDNGVDVEFTYDKKLNIYHPRIGVSREDIVFKYPGNVLEVKISQDATGLVNSLFARGKGIAESQLTTTVTDSSSQVSYLLREDLRDFSDIEDADLLESLATADLSANAAPLGIQSVVIDGSKFPEVGSYHIGDQVRLEVTGFQLYSYVNANFTIDKIEVTIDNDDKETVQVFLG